MTSIHHNGLDIFIAPELAYADFLRWQEELTQAVLTSPEKKFMILCSHPLLLTRGRGDRQNAHLQLTATLPQGIPVHDIKRGGGVTFHAPTQLIVYPIMKLTRDFGLNTYLEWLQQLVALWTYQATGVELTARRHPLGLWHGDRKVASIGVGINHFVTNHGLALNLQKIPMPATHFEQLNPCGMPSTLYTSLEDILERPVIWHEFVASIASHKFLL